MIARLIAAAPDNVSISLDGACPETHDSLRGCPGAFNRTLTAIKNLAEAVRNFRSPMSITIVSALSNENIEELDAIAKIIIDTGSVRWGILPLHAVIPPNSPEKPREARVDPDRLMAGISGRLRKLKATLKRSGTDSENSRSYLDLMEQAFEGKPFPYRCNAGYTTLVIDCNGLAYPCFPFVEAGRPCADVRGRRLNEIWNSEEFIAARRITTECRSCYWDCSAELSLMVPLL